MKPEFAKALETCLNFSCKYHYLLTFIESKGKAAFLLKSDAKRKSTRDEVEEVK